MFVSKWNKQETYYKAAWLISVSASNSDVEYNEVAWANFKGENLHGELVSYNLFWNLYGVEIQRVQYFHIIEDWSIIM